MALEIWKSSHEARVEFIDKFTKIVETEFAPDDLFREEFTEAFLLVMQLIIGPPEVAKIIRATQIMQDTVPFSRDIHSDQFIRINSGKYVLVSDVVSVGFVDSEYIRIEVVTTNGRYLLEYQDNESPEHAIQRFVDAVNCRLKAR